jgi:hypothetical protein
VKKADDLMRIAADRPALLIPLARCYAACAAGDPDASRAGQEVARMLQALGAAVRNGYRDAVILKTEPDFAPFRATPGFRALLDGLKATAKQAGRRDDAGTGGAAGAPR